ncbi:HAD family hydrolase [Janthinobacterium aquaticum]|uniref:HAD family hydrolase n=1 Tax=Janthinobacterium sp. FT58W TaxID=2654254 RepID=UPI00126593F5|nr:HAD-IA family hydrolase [Janthinobacterium sp. FT58W]KAB8041372.1 HAD-IA family hydrolase [Janthinobacterium sp. FT58W]
MTIAPLPAPRAILFDLDGTLADTAPDLAAAINLLRTRAGLPATAYDILRPTASAGARGLIGASYGIGPGESGYEALKDGFLNNYEAAMAVESTLFDGVPAMLQGLSDLGLAWGIVTNKAARFTDKLVGQIGLGAAGCVISGDTMAHPKPHPAPLLEAARRLNLAPEDCWYVGDDLRDIQAGRAAHMRTVACAWGYCGPVEPLSWNADYLLETPQALLALVTEVVKGRQLAA